MPEEKTLLNLIPTPQTVEREEGFVPFPKEITTDKKFAGLIPVAADYAKRMHGLALNEGENGLKILYDPALAEEGYVLDTAKMTIRACGYEGAAHGLASLLLLAKDGSLPKVKISDRPENPYRGLMEDLARQWHPLEQVLADVDLCFFYKCSYLQLHFIDDQSYTLPSRLYPKVPTEGRYYSFEEIAILNAYAKARGVKIVPEFETPGHSRALISAYPEQFGNNAMGEMQELNGAFRTDSDNILCAGKPGVFEAIDAMLGEVMELFPDSKFIHIGGDEAALARWNNCPDCQAFMEANDIPDVYALYTYFVKRVTDMVLARGRTPIVWEGFPKSGTENISRDVVVIAWESYYQLAPDLLASGFHIINCSWQPLYITPRRRWKPEEILGWDVYNWQHYNPFSPAYLNPIHVSPTALVRGGQLCAWECTYEEEIDVMVENLAALSERTWRTERVLPTEDFKAEMDAIRPVIQKILPPKRK